MSQDARLRATQRLGAADVEATLRRGRRHSSARLSLYCRPNRLAYARLALIVPKKLVRTAVQRNRVRRLAREAFRQTQAQLLGQDCVIRATRPPGSEPFSLPEMRDLLARATDA